MKGNWSGKFLPSQGVASDGYVSPISRHDKVLIFSPPPRQPNSVRSLTQNANDAMYTGTLSDSEVYATEAGMLSIGMAADKALQFYHSKVAWDFSKEESLLIQARFKTVGATTLSTYIIGNSDGSTDGMSLILYGPTHSLSPGRLVLNVKSPSNANPQVVLNPYRVMNKAEIDAMLGTAPLAWAVGNAYARDAYVKYSDNEYYQANNTIAANTAWVIGTSGATWRKASDKLNLVRLGTDTPHNVTVFIDGSSRQVQALVNGEYGANTDGGTFIPRGVTLPSPARNMGLGHIPADTSFVATGARPIRFQTLRYAVFPKEARPTSIGFLDFLFNKNPSVLFKDSDYLGA